MDKISTGKGPDQVQAGPQNDQIFVGDVSANAKLSSPLRIAGNLGADYIQLGQAWGEIYGDNMSNFDDGDPDTIEILGGHADKGYRIRCGGGADNVINGGPGNDEIYGNAGNDNSLHGGGGLDGISGGDGSDDILGGDGGDKISGDGGADTLNGEDGADDIYDFSDAWADTLRGGPGADKLYCNDNATLNPDFVFGEVDSDVFEFDDVESAPPETDADVPGGESATVKTPRPNESVPVSRGLLGW